jgi:hypothetical protein
MKKPDPKNYDVNDERINRINHLLSALPNVARRIDRINAVLYAGGISSVEFNSLVAERSALVKKYDDMERELKETYRIVNENPRKGVEITTINIE